MTLRIGLDGRFASARYDGVGRYVSALAGELTRCTDPPLLCILRPAADDPPRHPLPVDGERVVSVFAHRARHPESPWSVVEVPRISRSSRLDLWHTPFPLVSPRTGAPSAITLHDCIPERFGQYLGTVRRMVYRSTVAIATRQAQVIIVPSEQSADDAQRFHRVAPGKLRVIPEGVTPPPEPDPLSEMVARRRLGLGEGYVLTVGRPRPHKGYVTLVRALARIDPRHRPMWVRVGRPDPRLPDGSDRVAASLGVRLVTLEGLAEAELLAVYRGAALLAIPSLIEGFGLPLLEALAAATPVVASDIQPFRATGSGVARLVDAGVDAWTAALEASINDGAFMDAARRDGPARAQRFPWSDCAAATLDAYREAAS